MTNTKESTVQVPVSLIEDEDVMTPRQVCPSGCGCRKGTEDADWSDCACDGPCCYSDDWGPDAEFAARSEWWAEQ